MLKFMKKSAEAMVLSELAGWMNKAGRVFGNPLETDDLSERIRKARTDAGH